MQPRLTLPVPFGARPQETPVAGYALQVLSSPILERQPGACDEVSHRRRDKHFAGFCQRGDSRSDVYGNSAKLVAHDFALAGMEARSDLESERPYVVRDGAAHRASRAVERGQKAIPGGIDLATAKAGELAAFSVAPMMSVNNTVASTRSGSWTRRMPVRNSSISPSMASPSLSHGR